MLVKVLCEIDGRALRGMQWVLVEVLLCESDGLVLGGMQFGHSVWGVGGGAVLRECLPVLRE